MPETDNSVSRSILRNDALKYHGISILVGYNEKQPLQATPLQQPTSMTMVVLKQKRNGTWQQQVFHFPNLGET